MATGKDDQKQAPPSGATGASLSAEFAKIRKWDKIGDAGLVALGGIAGAIVGSAVPGPGTVIGAAVGAAVIGGGGVAIVENENTKDEQEMATVAKMDSYSSQIQAHYMSIHPDKWPPQGIKQFVEALQDKKVFDAVRSAAGKDADPSVVAALDEFAHLEQTRSDRTMNPEPAENAPAVHVVAIPPVR